MEEKAATDPPVHEGYEALEPDPSLLAQETASRHHLEEDTDQQSDGHQHVQGEREHGR